MKKIVTRTRTTIRTTTRTTTMTRTTQTTRTILTLLAIQMVCLAAFAGVASAANAEAVGLAEQTCNEMGSHVGFYNKNVDKIPSFMSPIFGNQKINLHISDKGSETIIGVQTKGMKIVELKKEPFKKPTMSVYVTKTLIDEGLAAKHTDPVSVLTDAWKAGEIKYKAHTYGMKARMFFAKFLI